MRWGFVRWLRAHPLYGRHHTLIVLNNTMTRKTPPPTDVGTPRRLPDQEHDPPWLSTVSVLQSLAQFKEVNRRCIEMLALAARKERPGSLTLAAHLKDVLQRTTPEIRARAAERPVLLTDMQLTNASWWRAAREHPTRPAPLPSWRGSFPKPAAVCLARATLMLAWHSLRSSPESAVLLGVLPGVAELIAELSLTDIDSIVERRFQHVRPRWEDRPAVWRRLLLAAESEDFRRARDFNLYSLQLVTGELWTSTGQSSG